MGFHPTKLLSTLFSLIKQPKISKENKAQCLTAWFCFLPSFLFRTSYWSAAFLSKTKSIFFPNSQVPLSFMHIKEPRLAIRLCQNMVVSHAWAVPFWSTTSTRETSGPLSSPGHGERARLSPPWCPPYGHCLSVYTHHTCRGDFAKRLVEDLSFLLHSLLFIPEGYLYLSKRVIEALGTPITAFSVAYEHLL